VLSAGELVGDKVAVESANVGEHARRRVLPTSSKTNSNNLLCMVLFDIEVHSILKVVDWRQLYYTRPPSLLRIY
ncbi:MAG: hypothetical protein ACK2UM_20345, partial [Anaerolineales bacterium]|jgi:hypothetical protein